MELARKASVTSYSLLAFIVFLAWKDASSCQISSPLNLTGNVGEDIIFKFNSTRGNQILAVKFGLSYGQEKNPVPKFITVKNLNSTLESTFATDDLNNSAADYKGRVSFVGDLEKGQAWFRLSNISPKDAKVYLASIREDPDNDYRRTKRFKLTVIKTEIISPKNSESSEKRFIGFDGLVMKKCMSYGIMDKESMSTVFVAIQEAYLKADLIKDIKINSFRKRNKTLTVTSGFNLTFTEPVNITYAYSFLQEAQQNNQLREYNITCFENIVPKLAEKTSDLVMVNIAVVIPISIILFTGFLSYYYYKKKFCSRSGVKLSNQELLLKTSESSPQEVPP